MDDSTKTARELSVERPSQGSAEKLGASFFASREFRLIFQIVVGFLLLGALLLIFAGAYSLSKLYEYNFKDPAQLTSGILLLASGGIASLLAMAGLLAMRYFIRVQKESFLLVKQDLVTIKEEDFEKFDQIKHLREEKAQVDFERNTQEPFLIQNFEIDGVDFFGPCSWRLRPGVNVLLGRNGYGKSLILRSLAALLQRNEAASGDLFASGREEGLLHLSVERGGRQEHIRRNPRRFLESPGKIPILAIPDSRFVSRQDTLIEGIRDKDGDGGVDLRSDGARHFLEDQPYGNMMRTLFTEMCYDYLEHRSFEQPIFTLLQRTIFGLTGDRFEFHSVERVGRNSFRLLVRTEGYDRPLPIQYASQGTLSVLGVVGIIRAYLRELFPGENEAHCLQKPAIVLIDELDAHLHPLWQQKLTGLLRSTFPNVQFVLTAHSPLVVAGCWVDEVTVLRRQEKGLVLQQLERDFLGTPVEEIYRVIFGVENPDESYLQSASRASFGFSHLERIRELEKKKEPTEQERRELPRLVREEGMILRAAAVKDERDDAQDHIERLEAKIDALQDELQAQAAKPEPEAGQEKFERGTSL